MAELEQALADARSEHTTAMKALEEYAERSLLVEREASKVKMDALMNTTADTIAGIETKAERRIAKLEKSLQDAEERHTFIVAEMRKDADGRMDSCMAKSDQDRESIMKHANAQIEAAKRKATMEVELKEKEITDNHDQHQAEISDLVKKHAEIIEEMKGENERLRSEIQKMTTEAQNVQKSLRGDLELVRTTSFKLEKVSECIIL
jgi:F0F1-type ATP synthase membrane subunit b/b'